MARRLGWELSESSSSCRAAAASTSSDGQVFVRRALHVHANFGECRGSKGVFGRPTLLTGRGPARLRSFLGGLKGLSFGLTLTGWHVLSDAFLQDDSVKRQD